MATKKKEPPKKEKTAKPPKKEKPTPLPCTCGRPAVSVKIGRVFCIYCTNAYCTEGLRARSESEEAAVKLWNTQASNKEAKK
jgi:hypothetical protein